MGLGILLLLSSSLSKDDKVDTDGEGESALSPRSSLIITDFPEDFVIGDAALGVVALELVVLGAVTRSGAGADGRHEMAISSFADTATGFFGW